MGVLSDLHVVIVPTWWPSPEQPHAGVFFGDYVEAFQSAGARVGVVYPDLVGLRHVARGARAPLRPDIRFETTQSGAPVVRVRGLQTSFGSIARRVRRFRDWLAHGLAAYCDQHGTPDALHAMCALPAGWACTQLDDPFSQRVVLTEHTGPFSLVMHPPASAQRVRSAFADAAACCVVSAHLREQVIAAGIDGELLVCGNPVSPVFASEAIGAAKRSPDAPRRGLFVGRFTGEKGIHELLTAIDAMEGAAANCRFDLVGADGSKDARGINSRIAESRVAGSIRVHPPCDRRSLRQLMLDADFLVHPTHGETFGMVVAEALCMGLPVVTTRGTACADFVNDDNGILVAKADASSLRDGLKQMIHNCRDYDRRRIASAARARFSSSAVAEFYAPLFRRICASA